MEAFLHGTRLLIPWHRDVYWFDVEKSYIELNGRIVPGSTRIVLHDSVACYFIDELDVLALMFPRKDEANPEYTSRRQEVIKFAERELAPYTEQHVF